MSKSKTYQLDGKGSVAFHNEDGKLVRYGKGDTVTAKELKEVPGRQQKFFSEVEEAEDVRSETSDEDPGKEPTLAEQIDEEFTVDELKEALDTAEVNYARSSKKAKLIEHYIKYIHEADEEE